MHSAFPIDDGHRFTLSYITLCYYILLYVTVINLRYIYIFNIACMQYPIHVQEVSRHIDKNVRITTTIFKAQIITSTLIQNYCGNRKRPTAAYNTHGTNIHHQNNIQNFQFQNHDIPIDSGFHS